MFDGAGVIVQYAYVVEDLDAAIEHWTSTVGAGPFFVRKHITDLQFEYRGSKSSIDMDLALGQAGTIQIELVKVNSGQSNAFASMYPQGSGGGFHHAAMFAKDLDAAIAAYQEKGFELAMKGIFGTTPFAFMDTRSALGFMIELYPETEEMKAVYGLIANAAKGWDRVEKTRPL